MQKHKFQATPRVISRKPTNKLIPTLPRKHQIIPNSRQATLVNNQLYYPIDKKPQVQIINVEARPKPNAPTQNRTKRFKNRNVIKNIVPPTRRTKNKLPSIIPQNHGIRKSNNIIKKIIPKNSSSQLKRKIDKSIDVEKIQAIKDVGIGRILVIIACGPTINDIPLEELSKLKYVDMMCINKPHPKVWPTKYWMFCDRSQYNRNKETFENNVVSTIINPYSIRTRNPKQVLLKTRQGKGFSKDMVMGFHIGRSTTYSSMQVAYYMNYDKIFILGCDMHVPKDGPTHFYGDNPDVNKDTREKRFVREAENFLFGASKLNELERSKYVFCSMKNTWPFVKYFEQVEHLEAIQRVKDLNKQYEQG